MPVWYYLSKVKALIFDFDGTIADSFETFLLIFQNVTGRSEPLTAKEVEDLRGKSLKQIIKYLKIRSWQIPRLIMKAKRQIALRVADIHPFPGMPAVLRQLHEDGFEMYILSTNSPDNIARFLKANGINDCFANIYGDIGLRGKAAGLKKIIKRQKLDKDNCLYIGDEVRDIEAARKAAIKAVAVGWGFNYPKTLKAAMPEAIVLKPKELLKVCI
jgi:phosphoglycolate phosphatase